MMCWIHRWRYDIEVSEDSTKERLRTCEKCHRHEYEFISFERGGPFVDMIRFSCDEYDKKFTELQESKRRIKKRRSDYRKEMKPKKDCRWWKK